MTFNFEWDQSKSEENEKKHNITFEEAKTVFNDPFSITISDPDHFSKKSVYPKFGSAKGLIEVSDSFDAPLFFPKGMEMITVNVPDKLSGKINEIARLVCQTPEEYILELIEERIAHDSAYKETSYLAESETNKMRLDKAVEDIRAKKYEAHELIGGND